MAITFISEIHITPDAANNLGAFHVECVIKDTSDTVLSSNNTVTVVFKRSDGTALTNSPLSLSASGGKYKGDIQLTAQAGVGIITAQVVNTNSTTSSVTVKSPLVYIRTVDSNSMVI